MNVINSDREIKTSKSSPIAIGGLGGSGTRIVAQILINSGIYLGNNLNASNDNLIFTRLFKNPTWLDVATDQEIRNRLRIFKKYMQGKKLTSKETITFINASLENKTFRSSYEEVARILLKNQGVKGKASEIWGWKEPNTHIFLKQIGKYFKGLKYIHVVRHGLDMAFSANLQQLYNWGKRFNVGIPLNYQLIPMAQLEYWIRSTKIAIEIGRKLLKDRFYYLNYDKLCKNPKEEVKKISDFISINSTGDQINKLASLPHVPESAGRYKKRNLNVFRASQLAEVENLGFKIEK